MTFGEQGPGIKFIGSDRDQQRLKYSRNHLDDQLDFNHSALFNIFNIIFPTN